MEFTVIYLESMFSILQKKNVKRIKQSYESKGI